MSKALEHMFKALEQKIYLGEKKKNLSLHIKKVRVGSITSQSLHFRYLDSENLT